MYYRPSHGYILPRFSQFLVGPVVQLVPGKFILVRRLMNFDQVNNLGFSSGLPVRTSKEELNHEMAIDVVVIREIVL